MYKMLILGFNGVVVRLPRHMEGNGVTPIFRSAVPPQAAGVVGTF